MFQGSVKLTGGIANIKTLYELAAAAITVRDYGSAAAEADAISRLRSPQAMQVFMRTKAGDLYMLDAWKGVRNGITTVAGPPAWIAADFTQEPGGGEIINESGKLIPGRVNIMTRLCYAVGDTVIYLDITEI